MVVNCAAYNFVDRAEASRKRPSPSTPGACATGAWPAATWAASLVHFSTDYVFGLDETRRHPVRRNDAPGPVSVYGLSKLAGEYLVRSLCPRHFVIRTCGLYGVWGSGGKGGNFVETMLRLAGQGKPLRVVADQICTPSYTVDVAAAAAALLRHAALRPVSPDQRGSCAWHEFAAAIFELAGVRGGPSAITSQEYGAAARRPAYSVLSMAAYEVLGLTPPRPWQEGAGGVPARAAAVRGGAKRGQTAWNSGF